MNTQRFLTTPLPASERPRAVYTYWVTGRGFFPIDMLRYDACWPSGGESSAGIADAIGEYAALPRRQSLRCIRIRSHQPPTIDRWSSFGWSVSADRHEVQ